MKNSQLENIEQLIEPIASAEGLELVACEWSTELGRKSLRVYVDKPGGVQLADCEQLSHLLGPVLDVEEIIHEKYNLEVSSPGLNRPLKKLEDFKKFAGEKIRLITDVPLNNRSRFTGVLEGIEKENILINVDGQSYKIPHSTLEKAHIEVNWDKIMKKKKQKK